MRITFRDHGRMGDDEGAGHTPVIYPEDRIARRAGLRQDHRVGIGAFGPGHDVHGKGMAGALEEEPTDLAKLVKLVGAGA